MSATEATLVISSENTKGMTVKFEIIIHEERRSGSALLAKHSIAYLNLKLARWILPSFN